MNWKPLTAMLSAYRQTLWKMKANPQKSKKWKHPKSRGRKRKKRTFDETRIGFFLKHEAPLEYDLIYNQMCGKGAPTADLIEQVGYSSFNPLFKKPKFRRALIEYRQYGLYCGKPISSDAKTEMYYIQLRRAANRKNKGGVK